MSWSQYRSDKLISTWIIRLLRKSGINERRSEGCGWSVISLVVSENGTLNVGNPVTVSLRIASGRDEWCLSLRVRLPDDGPKNEIARVNFCRT